MFYVTESFPLILCKKNVKELPFLINSVWKCQKHLRNAL